MNKAFLIEKEPFEKVINLPSEKDKSAQLNTNKQEYSNNKNEVKNNLNPTNPPGPCGMENPHACKNFK
jgi:hypothetical protein